MEEQESNQVWKAKVPMEEERKRSSPIWGLKLSRDRSKPAVARLSGQVEMWTVSNWESQWLTELNCDFIYAEKYLAFSADGSKLACKSGGIVTVLDAKSGEECNSEDTFEFTEVYSAYVS